MRGMVCSLILLSALAGPGHAQSLQEVLSNWRHAVHAGQTGTAALAKLSSQSNEDGVPGRVQEWITPADGYRSQVQRRFDGNELVATEALARRRDWNGWIREVQGQELSRLRTQILERRVTVFGPPENIPGTVTLQPGEKNICLIRMTPPGGSPITWFVDTRSWLPVKSVRPGDDSEISVAYEEWTQTTGIRTPRRVTVSETDKPTYERSQMALQFEPAILPGTFAAPQPGPADAVLAARAPPIRFTMENNHIVFKVAVNGRKPIGFLLDTGADETAINTPRLAALGLRTYGASLSTGGGGSAEYDLASGATFSLPGAVLRNQHVAVIDQTGLERALGIPLGGILGYDFISRFVVEIDYEKELLTLHDARSWKYSGAGHVVPITFDDGIPFTNGTLSVGPKTIPAYFIIDFGAAETLTLTSPFVKANALERLAQTNSFVNRPAGLENQFFAQNNVRGHIDRLAVGSLIEKSIPVNLSVNTQGAYASATFSGTIGESIFERFHVFLDYTRNRVILEPTAATQAAFPDRRTYGLTLIASGADLHTYTVTAVRPGSQAETDGFRKSDVISGLDHRSAAQFTLSKLREQLTHEGRRYEVRVLRGHETSTIAASIKLVSVDRA